jgi:hypothetical protein
MNNNCFRELKLGLSETHPIWTEHLTFDYGHVDIKNYDKANTFLRANLSLKYFENEPVYEIMVKYGLSAKIFLIQSQWQYNWHRDAFRSTAFNLLLTDDPEYLTLFAHTHSPDKETDIKNFTYSPTTRLIYRTNTFYLINAQIPHIAINYSSVDRYVLTIAKYEKDPLPSFFGKPVDLTSYDKTVADLTTQGLIL